MNDILLKTKPKFKGDRNNTTNLVIASCSMVASCIATLDMLFLYSTGSQYDPMYDHT